MRCQESHRVLYKFIKQSYSYVIHAQCQDDVSVNEDTATLIFISIQNSVPGYTRYWSSIAFRRVCRCTGSSGVKFFCYVTLSTSILHFFRAFLCLFFPLGYQLRIPLSHTLPSTRKTQAYDCYLLFFEERERERENQQDATIRCLLSTLSQNVSGIIMPIFRRTKDRVLLHVVCCAGSAGCGW